MRRKAGTLCQNGETDVFRRKSLFPDKPHDFGKQRHAVRSRKAIVRVGEIVSDVAQPRGGQEGIHQGMDEHVAVRMCNEPARVGDSYPAEHDMVSFVEGVGIDAESDAFGRGKVLGISEFFVGAVSPEDVRRRDVCRVHAAVVGEFFFALLFKRSLVCPQQAVAHKSLRRLYGENIFARGDGHDAAVPDKDGRVRCGQGAHAAAVFSDAGDAVIDDLFCDGRPRRVVDEHQVALCFVERKIDALRAERAADDGVCVREGVEKRRNARLVLCAAGDKDLIRNGGECRQRVAQDGQAVQLPQHLVFGKPGALSLPCGAENDADHAITS